MVYAFHQELENTNMKNAEIHFSHMQATELRAYILIKISLECHIARCINIKNSSSD